MRPSKWRYLPVHFIDTSVILGAFSEKEKFYYECKSYLNKVGYKYQGFLSTSVVGEIFMIIEGRRDEIERSLFFEFFDRTVLRRKINFVPSSFTVFNLVGRLRDIDYGIEALDAEHLSNSISNNANVFVTLDTKLVGNWRLEKMFGFRILHPRQM